MADIISKVNDIIDKYNSISTAVNGPDGTGLPFIDNSTASSLYDISSNIDSSLYILKNSELGLYKSRASETLKKKLETTKNESIISLDSELQVVKKNIEDMEEEQSDIFLEFFKQNIENNPDGIMKEYNNILNTYHSKSLTKVLIIHKIKNHYKEGVSEQIYKRVYNLLHMMITNIKLNHFKLRLFSFKTKSENKENTKKIIYPPHMDFKLPFLNDNGEEGAVSSDESNLINILTEILGISLETIEKLSVEDILNKVMYKYEDKFKENMVFILINISSNKDYVFSIKNIISDSAAAIKPESGITPKYIEVTSTISKDLEEYYVSPLSIDNYKATIYNYFDLYDASYYDMTSKVCIILRQPKSNSFIYKIFKPFDLIANPQVLNPDLISIDSKLTLEYGEECIKALNGMIPTLYDNKENSEDMKVYTPVKIGNIRHTAIQKLASYQRDQDKIQNTDKLIQIIFDSIYEEVLKKYGDGAEWNEEFYSAFYTAISRLVFKVRKDIMDRYYIAKNVEGAKEVVSDIINKMEKNISKADANMYHIYKIT